MHILPFFFPGKSTRLAYKTAKNDKHVMTQLVPYQISNVFLNFCFSLIDSDKTTETNLFIDWVRECNFPENGSD